MSKIFLTLGNRYSGLDFPESVKPECVSKTQQDYNDFVMLPSYSPVDERRSNKIFQRRLARLRKKELKKNMKEYEFVDSGTEDKSDEILSKIDEDIKLVPQTVADFVCASHNLYNGSLCDDDVKYLTKLVEDIGMFSAQLYKSIKYKDSALSLLAFINLYKYRIGHLSDSKHLDTLYDSFMCDIESVFEAQSFDGVSLSSLFTDFKTFRNCELFKKIYKFLGLIIYSGILERLNIKFDATIFKGLIDDHLSKNPFTMCLDMIEVTLETITFICERGYQCFKMGSVQPLFHNGETYLAWSEKVADLRIKSHFLSAPEGQGFTLHEFLGELEEAIFKGDAILKYGCSNYIEKNIVTKFLNELKMIKANETGVNFASQNRQAPFSVLIYGGSGLAKSAFSNLLFKVYSDIHGYPLKDEYIYTRNAVDPHWNNFRSQCWGLKLDDIGFLHPNIACKSGDPTLLEMLQVINNVPYVPPQASLEDKGRTPLRCAFVVATTNTKHLNTLGQFACPVAIRRRLPYVITLLPKECYDDGNGMLDPIKLPTSISGSPDDFWRIRVEKIIAKKETVLGETVLINEFDHIQDFICWFGKASKEFAELQTKAKYAESNLATFNVCKVCCNVVCKCEAQGVGDATRMYLFPFSYAKEIYECWQVSYNLGIRNYMLWCLLNRIFSRDGFVTLSYYTLLLLIGSAFPTLIQMFYSVFILLVYCIWFYYKYIFRRDDKVLLREMFLTMGKTVYNAHHRSIEKYTKRIIVCLAMLAGGKKLYSHIYEKEPQLPEMRPVAKCEEEENVWYKNEFVLTPCDVTPEMASLVNNSQRLYEKIERNLILLRMVRPHLGTERCIKFLGIGGTKYITNNHNVPVDTYVCQVITCSQINGVNTNTTVHLTESMFKRYPQHDILILDLKCLPPKTSLLPYFVKADVEGTHEVNYLSRDENGLIVKNHAKRMSFISKFKHDIFGEPTDIWQGRTDIVTQKGDCGATAVAETPRGPMILGIHSLGNTTASVACVTSVTSEFLISCLKDEFFAHTADIKLKSQGIDIDLVDLDKKSPVRFIDQGSARVYGSLTGRRTFWKSNVRPNLSYRAAKERGYIDRYGKPSMHKWAPWRKALQDLTKPVTGFNHDILEKCKESYLAKVKAGMTQEMLDEIRVYDTYTAVNGAPGVKFVDKMNRNTSMGFPWKKCKKNFMEPLPAEGEMQHPVKFTKEIEERIDEIEENYKKGILRQPIFNGSLKDEVKTKEKAASHSTRMFCSAPADWSVVVRKYFLSLTRVIQKNPFLFEMGPGMVCQSTTWDKLYKYLTQFGTDRIVAGDYRKYDKTMPAVIIMLAFSILMEIAKWAGYTFIQLLVMFGIANDTAYPTVDFNGDLIQFYGSNPSGHPLTVLINSIANSMYLRYAYYVLNPEKECLTFHIFVALMTYGDDNIMGISCFVSWFDHVAMHHVFMEIGIEYTAADKVSEIVPFIHIDDASFLKRKFRFDEDVGYYLCPLDEESIAKSLLYAVASKSVSDKEQNISIVSSAMREYFMYGQEKYIERMGILMDICEESGFLDYQQTSTFPSWNQLYQDFCYSSKIMSNGFVRVLQNVRFSQNLPLVLVTADVESFEVQSNSENGILNKILLGRSPKSLFRDVSKLEHKNASTCGINENQATCINFLGNFLNKLICTSICRSGCKENFCDTVIEFEAQSDIDTPNLRGSSQNYRATVNTPNLRGSRSGIAAKPDEYENDDNGVGGNSVTNTHERVQETTTFHDEDLGESTDIIGKIEKIADDLPVIEDAHLKDFFMRPVLIDQIAWSETDAVGALTAFKPWDLYFSNARIKNKAHNYAYFRGNLHVKAVINASPFYAGLMKLVYEPMKCTAFNKGVSRITAQTGNQERVQVSQLPGSYILPSSNAGCELILPFFWDTPFNTLTLSSSLQNMGIITPYIFNVLQSANGTTGTGVNITIYAWIEDLELSGPTLALAAQGDIERPSSVASAFGTAFGKLKNYPYIGGLATTTSIGLQSAASGLRALGFSNNPNTTDIQPMRTCPFPQLSNSDVSYPDEKLSLDVANELTIDPSIANLPPLDEMNISYLAQRESFIGTTNWVYSATTGGLICGGRVAPQYFVLNNSTQKCYNCPPVAWLSQAFSYWRGDFQLRIQLVATKFHRGRLLFVYDPKGSAAENIFNSSTMESAVYTQILDIGEENEYTINIPYTSQYSWCETGQFGASGFQLSPSYAHTEGTDTGNWGLFVLNDLSGPTASPTIDINVFVKGGNNFEFAGPSLALANNISNVGTNTFSYFEPQSMGDKIVLASDLSGEVGDQRPARYLINMGEKVENLKQLMKRTSLYCSGRRGTYDVDDQGSIILELPHYPLQYGYDPNGIHTGTKQAGGSTPFNYVLHSFNTYFAPAFAAQRGGMVYVVNAETSNTKSIKCISIGRSPYNSPALGWSTRSSHITSLSTAYQAGLYNRRQLTAGGAMTNQITQTGLSAHLPFYSNYKFFSTQPGANSTYNTNGIDKTKFEICLTCPTDVTDPDISDVMVSVYSHIGMDYQLLWFLSVPPLYYYASWPAAA